MRNEPTYREQLYRLALGRISKKERHELDLEALRDPFLFEAIEGYSGGHSTKSIEQSIKSLKKSMLVQKEKEKIPFSYRKTLAIAASVFGLIMLSYILIPQLGKLNGDHPTSLAENQKTKAVKSPVKSNNSNQKNAIGSPEPDSSMASMTTDSDIDTTGLESLDMLALSETATNEIQEEVDSKNIALIPGIPIEITQQDKSIIVLQKDIESTAEEETDEMFTVSKKIMSRLDMAAEELKPENEMAIITSTPNFQEVPISGQEAAKLSGYIKKAIEKEKDVFQNLPATMSFILSYNKDGDLIWVEGKSPCSTCNDALAVLIQEYAHLHKNTVYRERNVIYTFKSK